MIHCCCTRSLSFWCFIRAASRILRTYVVNFCLPHSALSMPYRSHTCHSGMSVMRSVCTVLSPYSIVLSAFHATGIFLGCGLCFKCHHFKDLSRLSLLHRLKASCIRALNEIVVLRRVHSHYLGRVHQTSLI